MVEGESLSPPQSKGTLFHLPQDSVVVASGVESWTEVGPHSGPSKKATKLEFLFKFLMSQSNKQLLLCS